MLRYAADYGEIVGTKGADNDPLDVYRGLFLKAEYAFIINQYNENGAFDEHKIMLNFYDEMQAKSAYELTTETPVREIFACTPSQLNWWLQYGNHKKPVTQQSFPFDSHNMTTEITNWVNEDQAAAQLIYAWRKTDEYGELTEPATLDSIVVDEIADGAEVQAVVFDALAVENKRLMRTAQALGRAFSSASNSLKVVENGIQVSTPMKKNGTTNIAVMFEMTDGQVVSVMFHNPDTTPQKITPDDMLVSWKWLLNRKDITIVVAKEHGKDLPLTTVARRVMALVEKNTGRFAKANANKAAETEELARLEAEKAAKLARLEELNAMIAERENALEISSDDEKDHTKLASSPELARHANDFITQYLPHLLSEKKEVVSKWLTDNALPDKLNQGVTNGYQALIDYIDERVLKDMADALSKEGHDVFDKQGNASLSKIRKVFLFTNAPQMGINSVLTGKEFGEFDLSSKEGKAELRQKAREYFETLRGKWVYNPHLDSQIEIRTRGITEVIQWSADVRKLQLLADIENIIATAVGVGTGFEVNGKLSEKPQVSNYFRLWNQASINGKVFKFQVMIERDGDGLLHYDLILPAKEVAVIDSASPHDSQTVEYAINNDYVLDSTDIDLDSQAHGILNIFIFDENGQEIGDEVIDDGLHNSPQRPSEDENKQRIQFFKKHQQTDWENNHLKFRKLLQAFRGTGLLSDDSFQKFNRATIKVSESVLHQAIQEFKEWVFTGKLPSEDSAKQSAIDYLNQIIKGAIDVMADGVMDKVLEIAEAFEQDDDVNAVLAQAIAVIENKMPKNVA